jgi:phosphohistidine phosphatase
MDIYVIRHAVAEHRDPLRWPNDDERPLTEDGAARMREAARGLQRVADPPTMVLSSPLVRAWQTARILHEEIAWPEPEELLELGPDRQPVEATTALAALDTVGPLALIGHEPHLSRLTSFLLTGGESLRVELKKGGTVRLATENEHVEPGELTLEWLLQPKALRAMSSRS